MGILGDLIGRDASIWRRIVGHINADRRFLSQTGNGSISALPVWSRITEGDIDLADNTINNASIARHGLLKKLSNVATEYMDGQGNWSIPAGGGGFSPKIGHGSHSSGNVTLNSATFADVHANLQATVPAAVNDWIFAYAHVMVQAVSNSETNFDVNITSAGTPHRMAGTNAGAAGWYVCPSNVIFISVSGPLIYKVVSGDLSAGNFTGILQYRTSPASNRTFFSNGVDFIATFSLVNMGPGT